MAKTLDPSGMALCDHYPNPEERERCQQGGQLSTNCSDVTGGENRGEDDSEQADMVAREQQQDKP